MKNCLILIVCFSFGFTLVAQGKFERKIIIEDSMFYAAEIVGQTGVLWKGNINEPMDSATHFALPVGTKRRSIHFLPLAWDMRSDTIYAINFTEYAQNERLSSFKSIPIKNLDKYNGQNNSKQLMQAAFENGKIENWPMVNMLKKYKYIDDLFFDFVVADSTVIQFISINNELTIWTYNNNTWERSEINPFETSGFFTTYISGNYPYLINAEGELYVYTDKLIITSSKTFPLGEKILIENRDDNTIKFINYNELNKTSLSLKQILEQH